MRKNYELNKIVTEPTEDDLLIIGYLLNIQINITSFTVSYQMDFGKDIFVSYAVLTKTYPIRYIQDFFKANADTPVDFYCPRMKR